MNIKIIGGIVIVVVWLAAYRYAPLFWAEYIQGVSLPWSIQDIDTKGGELGRLLNLDENGETTFTMHRADLLPLIRQFEGGQLRDSVVGDSVWYFGRTNPDSISSAYRSSSFGKHSGFQMWDPPTGADFVSLNCDSIDADHVYVTIISEWN